MLDGARLHVGYDPTMRKAALVCIGATALLLTGCGVTQRNTPTTMGQIEYLEEMRSVAALADYSDDRLIIMGENVCVSLHEGATTKQVADAITETVVSADEAARIVDTAARMHCPELLYAEPAS